MPNWNDLQNEHSKLGSVCDIVRRRYLKNLFNRTKRNVIIYYSGWLQRPDVPAEISMMLAINDNDKNGLMSVVHRLDRSKGLDIILHTPGGDMAATESIIAYLRAAFGNDVRAIVPQMAMSGGTMIACACREILMGKHSSIGPFDPQVGNTPAQAIKEEFDRASGEMSADPTKAFLWQPILQKYSLGFVSQCEKAIQMADDMVRDNLVTGMFADHPEKVTLANQVVAALGSHATTKMHNRHIDLEKAKALKLVIGDLESDQKLQDAVLAVHHAAMLTFEKTDAVKLVENHLGTTVVAGVARRRM